MIRGIVFSVVLPEKLAEHPMWEKGLWIVMAIELIIYEGLIVVGVALFLLGLTRASLSAGFAFTSLAGVIFLISGLFLLSNGVVLNQVSSYTDLGLTTQVNYVVATATNGSGVWVIGNILLYGGLGLVLLSLGHTIRTRRINAKEANDY